MTELTDQQQDLYVRLVDTQARKAELEQHEAELKSQLRANLGVGTYTIGGQKRVTLAPNRRFDPKLAERVLPAELLALCRVSKVDSATAKKVLPPALYEQVMAEVGEPVIRLA